MPFDNFYFKMLIKIYTTLLIMVGFVGPVFGAPPTVAIMDFQVSEALKSDGQDIMNLMDLLNADLSTNQDIKLLSRNEIHRVIKEQGLWVYGKIDANETLKLGQLLGVQYMIQGSIEKIENNNLLFVQVTMPENGVIVAADFYEDATINYSEALIKRFPAIKELISKSVGRKSSKKKCVAVNFFDNKSLFDRLDSLKNILPQYIISYLVKNSEFQLVNRTMLGNVIEETFIGTGFAEEKTGQKQGQAIISGIVIEGEIYESANSTEKLRDTVFDLNLTLQNKYKVVSQVKKKLRVSDIKEEMERLAETLVVSIRDYNLENQDNKEANQKEARARFYEAQKIAYKSHSGYLGGEKKLVDGIYFPVKETFTIADERKLEAIKDQIKEYESIIFLDPDYMLPYYSFGLCLSDKIIGKWREGVLILEDAAMKFPKHRGTPYLLGDLGKIYYLNNDFESAYKAFIRALDITDSNSLRQILGTISYIARYHLKDDEKTFVILVHMFKKICSDSKKLNGSSPWGNIHRELAIICDHLLLIPKYELDAKNIISKITQLQPVFSIYLARVMNSRLISSQKIKESAAIYKFIEGFIEAPISDLDDHAIRELTETVISVMDSNLKCGNVNIAESTIKKYLKNVSGSNVKLGVDNDMMLYYFLGDLFQTIKIYNEAADYFAQILIKHPNSIGNYDVIERLQECQKNINGAKVEFAPFCVRGFIPTENPVYAITESRGNILCGLAKAREPVRGSIVQGMGINPTIDGGLLVIDKNHQLNYIKSLKGIPVMALKKDSKGLWVGSFGYGLYKINPDNYEIEKHYSTVNGLPHDYINSLELDQSGLWIGMGKDSRGGLARLRNGFSQFDLISDDGNNSNFSAPVKPVTSLFSTKSGIYVGEYSIGVKYFDVIKEKWTIYKNFKDDNDEIRLIDSRISALCAIDEILWVGSDRANVMYDSTSMDSSRGVFLFNSENKQWKAINKINNDHLYRTANAIVSDGYYTWFAMFQESVSLKTNIVNGRSGMIVRYDVKRESSDIILLDKEKIGFPLSMFLYNKIIYVGTNKGLVIID